MKNHLHKMNRGILALLIVTSMFYSCSEADDVQNLEPEYIVKLKFDSYDDYYEELNKVSNMDIEERIAYEESKGYRSKRSIQEEFYISIDFEKFKSVDEIVQFVNNSEHLKIVYDENREMHVEINDDYSIKSLLVDENGIYQIDNIVYNLDQNKVYYTIEEHLKKLLVENKSLLSNDLIKSFPINHENTISSERLSCLTNRTEANERETNGGWRVYAAVKLEEEQKVRQVGFDHRGNPVYILEEWILKPTAKVRSYRRIGVWVWRVTDRLNLNVDFGISYRNRSSIIPNFRENIVRYNSRVHEWTGPEIKVPADPNDNPYWRFSFLNDTNTRFTGDKVDRWKTIDCNSTWTFFNN